MAERILYRRGRALPAGAVYVGRTRNGWQPWGNPFKLGAPHPFDPAFGPVTSREQAVALYAGWLATQPQLCERVIRELAGRDLACWCPPGSGPCHGDVLFELANIRLLALTEQQPWAWAIAHAGKTVENRIWAPPAVLIGQRLAIHGGRTWWPGWRDHTQLHTAWSAFQNQQNTDPGPFGPGNPFCVEGAIVAVATLRDAHRSTGDCCPPWGEPGPDHPTRGRTSVYHWVLDDILPLTHPIACRGRQGLWSPPSTVRAALIGALR